MENARQERDQGGIYQVVRMRGSKVIDVERVETQKRLQTQIRSRAWSLFLSGGLYGKWHFIGYLVVACLWEHVQLWGRWCHLYCKGVSDVRQDLH